jgi:hypothetical protein
MKGGRLYPDRWITGPDPERHHRYEVWLQQRNQAQWRGEIWALPFDAWLDMWQPLWHLRGRTRGTWCMSRQDWDGAWCPENVDIVPREQHAQRQRAYRARGWQSPARRRQLEQEQQ